MMELLSVNWNVDPAILHIGGFELRWYSLLFVSGFILGWYIMRSFFRRERIGENLLDPMLYMLLICTIVGARLGHVIFYQPDYYFGSWKGFLEIFMPWKGGLASHGGTIALLIGIWWYAKKYGPRNDFDFVWVLDHLVIPVSFAACFTRKAAFAWFVAMVLGLAIRTDKLGITSVVRDLSLKPEAYTCLLHFFKADSWKLSEIRQCWYRAIRSFIPLLRETERFLLVADGVKQSKEARRMPGVKRLHQESETQTKPDTIFGHM